MDHSWVDNERKVITEYCQRPPDWFQNQRELAIWAPTAISAFGVRHDNHIAKDRSPVDQPGD